MSPDADTETVSIEPDAVDSWLLAPEVERDDSELEELAQSLGEGQEEPITVRQDGDGYEGVHGYWRVQAVDQFGGDYGIEALTAEVRDMADFEAARSRLVRDVFHEPDTFMDKARLVDMVHQHFDSQAETAEYIGKSRSWVSKKLNRLSDPEPVQEAGEKGQIDENTAAELSEAAEEAPEAVEEAIDYASENPEASGEEVSQALEEARETDRDTTECRELVERVQSIEADRYRLAEQVAGRQRAKDEIEEIEADIKEIRTELPESQAREYEAFQEAQNRAHAMAEAHETLEGLVQALQESAENAALTDSQESKLEALKGDLRGLQESFGQPTLQTVTGDSQPVNVQETKGYDPLFPSNRTEGMELWTIRVVVDPNDPPEAIAEVRESLESYAEMAETAADYAASIQQAETFRDLADKVRSHVGSAFGVDTFDPGELTPDVRDAIESHSDKTMEQFEAAVEEAREEAENVDSEALEEAYDEYTDAMDRLESLNDRKGQIEADMPPSNVAANLSQKEDTLEEAREEAIQAFEALPEDTREELADTFAEAYEGVDWLPGVEEGPETCQYIKGDGEQCQNPAQDDGYCHIDSHRPETPEGGEEEAAA